MENKKYTEINKEQDASLVKKKIAYDFLYNEIDQEIQKIVFDDEPKEETKSSKDLNKYLLLKKLIYP